MKSAAAALLVGAGLAAAAVWLKDYEHRVSFWNHGVRVSRLEPPEWADPAAAAAALLGVALVLIAVVRLTRAR